MATSLQEQPMAPAFQLDYVSHQPTLHFIIAGQQVRMPKDVEHCFLKQIIGYEKRMGMHPACLIYYGCQYDLIRTDAADQWLMGVWLANTPSAYQQPAHQ